MQAKLISPEIIKHCFAKTYALAQQNFKTSVERLNTADYQTFSFDQLGPENETLATAVSWIGRADASRVLVLQSATHGIEGFAGSAIQLDFLKHQLHKLTDTDVSVLLIHAINPYGFAWLRRVNEDGVDLNRNFIDFTQALPKNTIYAELANKLLPAHEQDLESSWADLLTWRDNNGQGLFEEGITRGQYDYPDGLFYGGQAASQSRKNLEKIISDFDLAGRDYVAVIDIHTGLGPFSYGELICDHAPNSSAVAWARNVYGQSVTEPALGTSSSAPKDGLLDYCWHQALNDRICFVTLEFGTYSIEKMFAALRADHLLHRQTFDWNDSHVQAIKQTLKQFFYPATADWQELVLLRGRQVIAQAIQGLCEQSA